MKAITLRGYNSKGTIVNYEIPILDYGTKFFLVPYHLDILKRRLVKYTETIYKAPSDIITLIETHLRKEQHKGESLMCDICGNIFPHDGSEGGAFVCDRCLARK